MTMRHFTLTVCIVWLYALFPHTSYACSCIKPEVSQAFSDAREVFTGEVIDVIKPRTDDPKALLVDRLYAIKFKVEKSWKGRGDREITILSDQGRAGCFSWGSFLKGKKYLVYAEKRTPAGVTIRSLAVLFSCNRTALFTNAAEDLKELDAMRNHNFQLFSP